jgi:ADP-ribose pyrophosphatase YjhB (NUDIX family)
VTAVDAATGSGAPGECARQQRVAAYGILHDIGDGGRVGDGGDVRDRPDGGDGPTRARRILLVRAAPYLSVAGRWFLPGGGVEHGEAPLEALRREVAEESGLTVGDATLAGVLSDTWPIPDGTLLHTVRIIYRVHSWEGATRSEAGGSSDLAQWFAVEELARLPLVRYAREALATFG